jgi:outer membrane protein insertion porin family/translocation and assembly module TamA
VACLQAACASIPAGQKAIDSVDIVGTDAIDSSDVKQRIATADSPRFLGLWQGFAFDYELYDPYVLARDLERVERLYRARGYYEAHVRAGRVEHVGEKHVRVTIVVEEGVPVRVGDVRLDGLTSLPIDDSAAALKATRNKLRHGELFDENDFIAAEKGIREALTDRGYAFARTSGETKVDLPRHVADVTYAVDAGQLARLGPITITGLEGVPEAPVRRALDLSEGDSYSSSKLESARHAALALGVFGTVEVLPNLENRSLPVVPITVRVVPTKLRSLKLGFGVELDSIRTDLHLNAGWEDRNFLGGLRRLSFDLKPGVVLWPTRLPTFDKPTDLLPESKARMELRQPGFIEARTGGVVRGEFNIYPVLFKELATFDQIQGYRDLKAGAGVDRTFGSLYASLFYNYQISFPFLYSGDDKGAKKVVLSYVDLTTTLDFRDDVIRPHKGIFIGNDVQFAGLGGGVSGSLFAKDVKVQPEIRGYIPISRTVTFAVRTTVGFLFPRNYRQAPTLDTPAGQRDDDTQIVYFRGFFSGGPNSNRGYPYRGIGPRGPVNFFLPASFPLQIAGDCKNNPDLAQCQFPLGGLTLWEASAEVRFPILGQLGGATFCDASDVSEDRSVRLNYPHLSCGGGLHYGTPVGPLRFDMGWQIPGAQGPRGYQEMADNPGYAVSIGIGEAF